MSHRVSISKKKHNCLQQHRHRNETCGGTGLIGGTHFDATPRLTNFAKVTFDPETCAFFYVFFTNNAFQDCQLKPTMTYTFTHYRRQNISN